MQSTPHSELFALLFMSHSIPFYSLISIEARKMLLQCDREGGFLKAVGFTDEKVMLDVGGKSL